MPHQETLSKKVTDVASKQAAKGPAPRSELDQLSTMPAERLVAQIGHDADRATQVVLHRPDAVGEIMQRALASNPATAMVVLAALRYEFVRHHGASFQTDAWVRSVMRLTGPRADEVKIAMQAIIDETHAEQAKNDRPMGRSLAKVDGLDDKMALAKQDPETGKLYANFFDRPAEVVSQLLGDRANPKTLERHVSVLVQLMQSAPAAGHEVIAVLGTSRDPDWFELKHKIVARLHGAVDHELREIDKGHIQDDLEGGARGRLERMIPLLAEIVCQPDVAAVMTDMQVRGTGTSELRNVMKHVLDWSYSEATRQSVRRSIGKGASEMFHESLVEKDEDRRPGMALRAGEFLGTAARGAADSGPEKSVAKQMGMLLQQMSSLVPKGYSTAVKTAAGVLTAVGKEKTPKTWSREELSQLLHRIYASVNPSPPDLPQMPNAKKYEESFRKWAEGPLNTYSSIRDDHD